MPRPPDPHTWWNLPSQSIPVVQMSVLQSEKQRERPRRQLRANKRSGLGCRSSDAFGVEPCVSRGLQFPCRLQDVCHKGIPKDSPGSHISVSAIYLCFRRSSTCGLCHFAETGRQGAGVPRLVSSSEFNEKPSFSLALPSGSLGPSRRAAPSSQEDWNGPAV